MLNGDRRRNRFLNIRDADMGRSLDTARVQALSVRGSGIAPPIRIARETGFQLGSTSYGFPTPFFKGIWPRHLE